VNFDGKANPFCKLTNIFFIPETDLDEEVPDMAEFEAQEDDKENGQVGFVFTSFY